MPKVSGAMQHLLKKGLATDIKEAAEIIKRGGVVVYPTETVYGLGAHAYLENAIRRVIEIKNRPPDKPISIAVSSFDMITGAAVVDEKAKKFIDSFLPGPVTVLLKRKPYISSLLTGGSDVIGIRFPDDRITLSLIELTGAPITSTSANIAGKNPPRSIDELDDEISKKVDFVIKGGRCAHGEPSTVIDLVNMKIARKGAYYEKVRKWLEES